MALVDYADSDDEEHLVDYSDSDDARDATQTQISNTKAAMPPLPAEFHDMYAADARVSVRDDPSLHQGRKRSTPHVEGNWPSHLYLECNSHSSMQALLLYLADFLEGVLLLQNRTNYLP